MIAIDNSDFGLGAVLTQKFDEGERVISYISRSLNGCERKYATTGKDCLAIVFAIEMFRPYIEGTRFTALQITIASSG